MEDRIQKRQTLPIPPDSAFAFVVRAVEGRRRFHVTKVDPKARSIDFKVLFSLWHLVIPNSHYASESEAWVTVEEGEGGGSVVTFTSEPEDSWFPVSINQVDGRAAARRLFKDLRRAVAG